MSAEQKEMKEIAYMTNVNTICREGWTRLKKDDESTDAAFKVNEWAKSRMKKAGYEVEVGDEVYFKAPDVSLFSKRSYSTWDYLRP